jgi:hypothetical protein
VSLTELNDSAPAEGVTTADPPAADSGVTTATSPTAEKGADNLVDHLMKVMNEKEESPSSDEPGSDTTAKAASESDKATTSDDQTDDEEDLAPEELARLNQKTRTRITKLLDQRQTLRNEVQTTKTELERQKPLVEDYEKIRGFMRQHDISPKDFSDALRLTGLVQTNPIEAFKAMQPIYARLAQAAGAVLPDDLAEDMRLGRITQQRAHELAVARASQNVNQQRAAREAERQQREQAEQAQRQEAERAQKHAQDMAKVGDQLAAEKVATDPDWKLKEKSVEDLLKLDLVQNGMPKDANDLRARFNKIVGEVEKRFAVFKPKPAAIARPPQTSSSPAKQLPPAKSFEEHMARMMDGM